MNTNLSTFWRCNSATVLMLGIGLVGCSGSTSKVPPVANNTVTSMAAMENEHKQIRQNIEKVQKEVETLVFRIIKNMEQDKLDVDSEIQDVQKTTAKVKELRDKIRPKTGSERDPLT